MCLAASGALSPAVDRSPMLATGSTDVVVIILDIFLVLGYKNFLYYQQLSSCSLTFLMEIGCTCGVVSK